MEVMMAFQDTDTVFWPATIPNQCETQRQRHGGPILEKPKFNWDAQDRYVELLNFKMEVTNILETGAYRINDEEKSLSYSKLARSGGPVADKNIHTRRKGEMKTMMGLFSGLSSTFKPCHN